MATSATQCITIGDLTGGEIRGNGDFDELMRTVKSNLEDQYKKQRITGSSYSTVYLGALTQVLETAAAFTLTKGKASQEILLLEEQVRQSEWQTCLIMKQIEALDADIAIKKCQLIIMTSEELAIQANTCLTNAKTAESVKTLDVMASTIEVNCAQVGKIVADTGYTTQQCLVAKQQEILITCQQLSTAAQTDLVNQKKVTELAQVDSSALVGFTTIPGCACSYTGGGLLGAQLALQYKQRDTFDRDAEQKYAKIMQDSFAVQLSVLGDYEGVDVAKLAPIDIGKALSLVSGKLGIP